MRRYIKRTFVTRGKERMSRLTLNRKERTRR